MSGKVLELPPLADGKRRKAERLALLEERRTVYINRGRRVLLLRLLNVGTATADHVRALVELPDEIDPRCLGAVPRALVKAGIIARSGYTATTRPERHASVITVWRLADAQAARQWLTEHPDHPDPLPDQGNVGTLFDLELFVRERPAGVPVRC